ncbi:MAG: hypothetical protein M9887_09650 [Chitinophagales bacterium]|nr:hypothetical protein [Chitinophagales bacterium]
MNLIVTYIYPKALSYFADFIDSINRQDCNNFKLLIFNDGVDYPQQYFTALKISHTFVGVSNKGINAIRYFSIDYLRQRKDIDKIIFQDIDDMASNNRYSCLINLLDKYDLVCNDLIPFTNDKKDRNSGIWKNKIEDLYQFTYKDIRRYNFVGLGNTAIRHSILKDPVNFNENVIAYDWFLFYQLMKKSNCRAVFTSECYTLYRQHESNIAGASTILDTNRLPHIFNVKTQHYLALIKTGHSELEEDLADLEYKKKKINHYKKTYPNKSLFWWEETEVI